MLGPLAERALRKSLIISDAGVMVCFTRPISAVLVALALAAVAVPIVRWGWGMTQRARPVPIR